MADTFKITNIDDVNNVASVEFSFEGLVTAPQHLANLPLNDATQLAQTLSDYSRAYRMGLEQEHANQSVSKDVLAMQNKDQDVLPEVSTSQDVPADQAPVETPAQPVDAPVDQAPVDQAPVDQAPVDATPVEAAPTVS